MQQAAQAPIETQAHSAQKVSQELDISHCCLVFHYPVFVFFVLPNKFLVVFPAVFIAYAN